MRVMAPAAIPVGAVVSGTANSSPTPGCNRVTMTRPRLREKSEAIMNQPSVLKPMRPTVLLSPILAMPTVRVVNTSGAMIILMRRRKISVSMVIFAVKLVIMAASGARERTRCPTRMPSSILIRIAAVSLFIFIWEHPSSIA